MVLESGIGGDASVNLPKFFKIDEPILNVGLQGFIKLPHITKHDIDERNDWLQHTLVNDISVRFVIFSVRRNLQEGNNG